MDKDYNKDTKRQVSKGHMDNKDTIKNINTTQRLVQIDEYYRNIFKKTEKIVSVVFYISGKVESTGRETVLEDILTAARAAHSAVLDSLEMRLHVAEDGLRKVAHNMISLESKLRVAEGTGLFAPEIMNVFVNEIDSVLRNVNRFLKATSAFDDVNYGLGAAWSESTVSNPTVHSEPTRKTVAAAQPQSKEITDRKERIKALLKTGEPVTIKDISEVIKDCSEKTIQRELNTMIDNNEVQRIGEKRWSKYTLM